MTRAQRQRLPRGWILNVVHLYLHFPSFNWLEALPCWIVGEKIRWIELMKSFFKTWLNFSLSLCVTDNEFVCDCRLAWIFDLKNRTKNFELRYSLEEIECMTKTKERPTAVRVKVNVEDVMKKQVLNDDIEYYEDESYDDKKTSQLLQLKQKELPCPQQYREQLEHPSTREFIGFDLSWIHSSATKAQIESPVVSLLFLALISHLAGTFAAYFR